MRIYLGLPTHSGTSTVVTIQTLLKLQKAVLERGWTLDFEFFSNSLITYVRNVIVADFLARDYDVLLMIDSDQGAHVDTLMKMLESAYPVVGVMYPRRKLDLELMRKQPAGPIDNLLHRGSSYVGTLKPETEGRTDYAIINGYARALYVGTGLIAIKRDVFDKLMQAMPEMEGKGYPPQDWPGDRFKRNWGFFNLLDEDDPPLRLSEDFAFCHRWRTRCDGEIWADVTAETVHVGQYGYTGSYLEFLKANYSVKQSKKL